MFIIDILQVFIVSLLNIAKLNIRLTGTTKYISVVRSVSNVTFNYII